MSPGKRRRRRAVICVPAVLALAFSVAPASPGAAATRPADGALSPRLAELAKPGVRAAPPAKQARRLGVAKRGPGSLLRDGNRVLVDVRFEKGAAGGVDGLRATGARIVNVSRRYQTVTIAARPGQLRSLTGVPRVAGATEVLTPIVHAAGAGPTTAAIVPCFGAATSEGDEQLRAAQARADFEVDGSGVKVGVLSDSFDLDSEETSAAQDIASGDLPGAANPCEWLSSVDVIDEYEPGPEAENGSDEGRAMAQIVHDLAPGAELAFATAFNGLFGFAENIEDLGEAGARVIVDDVAYFEEPFFQEGPVGVAVSNVTTEDQVAYFSSAGNNNLRTKGGEEKDFASWETLAYRDAGACPAGSPEYAEHCLDFDPDGGTDDTGFSITVNAGRTLTVDLQWAQPWFGVTTDLDAYLLAEGAVLAGEGEESHNTVNQRPVEILSWTNESGSARTVELVVNRCDVECDPEDGGDAEAPTVKFSLLQNGGGVSATEYPESSEGDVVGPTIFGHNGAADAMSVGAIRHDTTEAPERFSSRGPVTHYFGPVDGVEPAEELPAAPEALEKPDVIATDGGANTFFGQCLDAWRFFGTSAAAPHAAAVAALQLNAEPGASAAELKEAQRETAAEVPGFPATAVGTGIVDAVAAIEAMVGSGTEAAAEAAPASIPCAEVDPEDDPEEPEEDEEPEPAVPAVVPPAVAPDLVPPQTFIQKRPGRVVFTPWRRGRAVFRFRSNEPGVFFFCQFDRKRWRRCGPRFVRWFRVGRHVLRVRARDAAGNLDATPAVHRFRVRRVSKKRFARIREARRQARHGR